MSAPRPLSRWGKLKGEVIPKGETVEIERLEGIKLIVRAKAAVPVG